MWVENGLGAQLMIIAGLWRSMRITMRRGRQMIEQFGESIPCRECEGSGFLFGTVCGNCHGGYIGSGSGGKEVMEQERVSVPCGKCFGNGYIFGEVCGNCTGGYVGVKMRHSGAGVIAGMGAGMKAALKSIIEERHRQDQKWGQQNHDPIVWSAILGEEVGELCQAILETHFDNGPEARAKGGHANMRAEAVQVGAVVEAFIEYLDRVEAKRVKAECERLSAEYFNAPEVTLRSLEEDPDLPCCPDFECPGLPIVPDYRNMGGCI
jgi:hypothetical protein